MQHGEVHWLPGVFTKKSQIAVPKNLRKKTLKLKQKHSHMMLLQIPPKLKQLFTKIVPLVAQVFGEWISESFRHFSFEKMECIFDIQATVLRKPA